MARNGRIAMLVGICTARLCAQPFTALVGLPGTSLSGTPSGPLLQASDGNFYLTSGPECGVVDGGAVFKMTASGLLTALYQHQLSNENSGFCPQGGVIQASDGNLYGTMNRGGAKGGGTVFKLSLSGTLTALYSFSTSATDGIEPSSGVIQATDGNFYGTTTYGGTNSKGTIFRVTPAGGFTTLYAFGTTTTDGLNPYGRLVQGSDGSLYGTTSGGAASEATIFKISLTGVLATLYTFPANGMMGRDPQSGLIQKDGNFYGTTSSGGKIGYGTVYQITPAGALTTIYSFGTATSDGINPTGALFQASDGNLYGVTPQGGHAYGTMFRVTTAGVLTTLHAFAQSDGTSPNAALIQATDGSLYGVTSTGGYTGFGTIYKYFLSATPPPAPTITSNGVVPVYSSVPTIEQGEWISIYGSNLAGTTAIWNGDFPVTLAETNVSINGKPAYLWFVSPGQINLQAPNDTAIGTVPVVVTTPGGSATTTVTLAQIAPSFSLLDGKHVAGIILRTDGSGAYGGGTYDILGPTGNSLGYATVAARAADTVELFAVGLGPTKPAVPAGASFSASAPTTSAVTLFVNNASVTPLYSGETTAGLYQINFTVPPGLGSGDVTLSAVVGGVQTPAGVVISLR